MATLPGSGLLGGVVCFWDRGEMRFRALTIPALVGRWVGSGGGKPYGFRYTEEG